MAALEDGSYAYLLYSGDALWHERLLLSWVTGSTYMVLSSDADLFLEQVDASNPDLGRLRFGAPGGWLPFGLRGQPIYAFAPRPDGGDLAGVLAEGRRFASPQRLVRLREAGGRVACVRAADGVEPRLGLCAPRAARF